MIYAGSGQRDAWRIRFPVATVIDAIKARIAHHEKRLAFWEEQIAFIKKDIRDKGIEITEHITERKFSYSNSMSAAASNGPRVSIDQQMLKDLNDAAGRRTANRSALHNYRTWLVYFTHPKAVVDALYTAEASAEPQLELQFTDYNYFFLDDSDEPNPADDF